MKFFETLTVACLFSLNTPVFAHPQPGAEIQLHRREAEAVAADTANIFAPVSSLFKRKGGGGGGGKGGGGGSSSSGSGSGSGSSGKGGGSTSSGGSSSGSSGSSGGRGSSSSNAGGSTRTGSGVAPAYGGGRYYGGGATTPYSSGGRSPRGIAPIFLGVGLLAIFPGIWLYGAYSYPYTHPYSFRNRTGTRNSTDNTNTPTRDINFGDIVMRQDDAGVNETKPVNCLCAQYAVCGCDDDGTTTFLDSVIGDGSYDQLNKSVINVVDVNGTSTIVLNGTLPNGTTAAGGTEDAAGSTEDASGSTGAAGVVQATGYWLMIAIVGLTCFAI